MAEEKKRKWLQLTTPEQVRRYIQGLMIKVENGEIELSKARLLTIQAETILKAIQQKEAEQRLIELETELEKLAKE